MPERTLLRPEALAAVRTGVGVVMLLAPQLLPRVLGIDAPARARTSWAVQMLGAREVALGVGALTAAGSAASRSWTVAGSACDVADAVVLTRAVLGGAVSRRWGGAVALSALAAGAVGTALGARPR